MSRAGLALAYALMAATPVLAQETLANRTEYPASYFAPFQPQTALDMVQRLPGFVLDAGAADVRGFGGAAGNVLIDGVRPTSKAGGIEDALRRIPAAQVVRIELSRGSTNASEAQGQAVVANVVRGAGARSGTWTLEAERNGSGLLYPRGEANFTGQVAGWDGAVKVNAFWEQFPFRTLRSLRRADGTLLQTQIDDRPTTLTQAFVSGEAKRPAGGGTMRVTGRFGWEYFYYDLDSDIFLAREPGDAPDQRNTFEYDRTSLVGEVGADWTRTLAADWTLKLVGLGSGTGYAEDQDDFRFITDRSSPLRRSALRVRQRPLEAVARGTVARGGSHAFRPELGVEAAYNRLRSELSLVVEDDGGVRAIALPAANVVVEEVRGEAFGNAVQRIGPKLILEGGVAVEASRITVTGDSANEQSFVFWKPSLAVVYAPTSSLQLRAGVRRIVGQLDFTDFAASARLQDDQSLGGNPDLGPAQTTRYSVSADWRRPAGGAANLELFREARRDVLEFVRLPSGAEGLGNAGSATVDGVKAGFTAPLGRWLPGATIKANGEALTSVFLDPLTGRERDVTGLRTPIVSAEFRRDQPGGRWSWGATYEGGTRSEDIYLDEVDSAENSPRLGAFVETAAFTGLKTTLTLRSLATERYIRTRQLFRPDRAGVLDRVEERRSARGAFLNLTVSGRF